MVSGLFRRALIVRLYKNDANPRSRVIVQTDHDRGVLLDPVFVLQAVETIRGSGVDLINSMYLIQILQCQNAR